MVIGRATQYDRYSVHSRSQGPGKVDVTVGGWQEPKVGYFA